MVKAITPIGRIISLAASGEVIVGNVTMERPRNFMVSCRVTYNAAATGAVRVRLFFSPDGQNYDTVPYTTFDPDLTAGATVQESASIDAPEKGFLKLTVQNLDAVYAASGISVWVTQQPFPD